MSASIISLPTAARDLHGEVASLTDELYQIVPGIPCDGLTPGYLLSAQTQEDLRRAIPLLEEALRLLEHAQDHEDPIYNDYCDARERSAG